MSLPGKEDNGGDPDSSFNAIRRTGPLLTAGIQMAATIVIMFFLGRWLDTKFGTDPWLMTVGGLFGSGGGLYSFIKTALNVSRTESGERPAKGKK